MIEVISAQRCIQCDVCVKVCPTNVFDRGPDGVPVISRQQDCQTCFQCEANCPVDAMFVSPSTAPTQVADRPLPLMGSYRAQIGWGRGRKPGSLHAVGPEVRPGEQRIIS